MSCDRTEALLGAWLLGDVPEELAAHGRACDTCAAALGREAELGAALGAVGTPKGFAANVMKKIARGGEIVSDPVSRMYGSNGGRSAATAGRGAGTGTGAGAGAGAGVGAGVGARAGTGDGTGTDVRWRGTTAWPSKERGAGAPRGRRSAPDRHPPAPAGGERGGSGERRAGGRRMSAGALGVALLASCAVAWAAASLLTARQERGAKPPGAAEVARALLPPLPQVALEAPVRLTVGDEVEVALVVRWPGSAPVEVALEPGASPALGLAGLAPARIGLAPGEERRFVGRLTARRPGAAALAVKVATGERTAVAERAVLVGPRDREVALATTVELEGEETRVTVPLDPRAARLGEPRWLELRTIPGLVAEAELGLRGLVRVPIGCFEQTTAATYPSLLVLALSQQPGRADEALAAEARRQVLAGAARLASFQLHDGSFSLHGQGPGVPWLTAYGLAELAHIARVLPEAVDRARIDHAAQALLNLRSPSGRILASPGRSGGSGDLAVTAFAVSALLAAGVEPAAIESSIAWVESESVPAERTTYALALAAKALHAAGRSEAATALAARIGERAIRDERGRARWEGDWTLTGTGARDALIETTALAVQVLLASGDRGLAGDGLRTLEASRRPEGFGGTQATVQTLEAFRLTDPRAAKGVVEARIAGLEAGRIEIEAGDGLGEAALAPADLPAEDVVRLALERGVELRFRGEGRLAAQVVVRGTAPWSDHELSSGERREAPPALQVTIDRPRDAAADSVQRWTVRVRNGGPFRVASPMVEVGLPPGFEVAGARDLDALVLSGVLRAHEMHRDGLALYVADLAPGGVATVPFGVVARFAGRFSSGPVEVYPYYRQAESAVVPAVDLRVRAPGEAGPRERVPATSSNAPAAVAAPSRPAATPAPPPRVPEDATSRRTPESVPDKAPGELVIGFDERLGPLEIASLRDPRSPLRRLLVLALFEGPDVERASGDTEKKGWEVHLKPATWSDGSPVTAHDFVDALKGRPRTAQDYDAGEYIWAEAVGPYTLRIVLDRSTPDLVERLGGYPFLPWSRFSRVDDPDPRAVLTNGPYRIEHADEREMLLGPAPGRSKGAPPIRIRRMSRDDMDSRVDLGWTSPQEEEHRGGSCVPRWSVWVTLKAGLDKTRRERLEQALRYAMSPYSSSETGQAPAGLAELRSIVVAYAPELVRVAEGIQTALGKQGVEAKLVPADGRSQRYEVHLRSHQERMEARRGGKDAESGFVGYELESELLPVRARPAGDALDALGCLRYPPRIER